MWRGPGLMIATEFSKADGSPNAEDTSLMVKACIKRGLLLLSCGSYKNVIRWIPPLVVTEEQIDESLAIFESALTEVFSE